MIVYFLMEFHRSKILSFKVLDMTNTVSMSNTTSLNDKENKSKFDCYFFIDAFHSFAFLRSKRVNIELGEIHQHNLKQLQVLNRNIFPVSYNEKFYKDLLEAGELCKLGNLNFSE